ncbi:MAG: tRNA threonylcarbamoyladenosine dehydratase [Cyanobacteria bacterium SIG31]|nr:tRNA threonylcarbamoyladenosine dehydratase [Cyanobacteria bacterium SIG31]
MENQFSRTETLIGKEALAKLSSSRVAIFGIGGVGGHVVEALARSGVGTLDLIDNDAVSLTNLNRQIIALHSTIGQNKVEVAKKRALDINPNINVNTYKTFFNAEVSKEFDFSQYDYVIDAIDSVSGKIELVQKSIEANVPIISSMGAGNKLHPELFEISDIYKTSVCPLAKVMRQELKKRGIKKLKVVYSKELPHKNEGQRLPASISFVPSVAGLIIAGVVVRDLIE